MKRPTDDQVVQEVVDLLAQHDGQLGLNDVEARLPHLPRTRVRKVVKDCERLGYVRRTGVKRTTRLWVG